MERMLRDLEPIMAYYGRLARVQDHVRAHLSDRLALAEGARVAACDPNYFSAWFHNCVGMTFSRWVKCMRVSQACAIMRTSDATISEVAEAVGFRSVRTLDRAFSTLIGLPPLEYKLLVRPQGSSKSS